nr:MAG: hypothetical protein GM42_4210 [actinobacterium acMicro-1]
MKIALRSVIAGVSVVLVSAVLAACAPMPADDTEREASRLGSRLCIHNETSMQMRVQWRGFPAPIDIAQGETQCNSGYESSKNDVEATIEYQPEDDPGNWLSLSAFANNRFIGYPESAVWYDQQKFMYGTCGQFSEGDTRTFQTFMFRADLTRHDDSGDNKEFSLTLSGPSGRNSADEVSSCVNPKDPNPL